MNILSHIATDHSDVNLYSEQTSIHKEDVVSTLQYLQPGALLQGTVCHLPITRCTGASRTLYGEEKDQNRGKVYQVDS